MKRQQKHRTVAVAKSIKKGIETWRKKKKEVKSNARRSNHL